MHAVTLVEVVAIVLTVASAGTKILSATRLFWDRFGFAGRIAPSAALVLGALPASLTGVHTWTDFAIAVIVAVSLALPSKPPLPKPAAHAAKIVMREMKAEKVRAKQERERTTINPPPLAMLALCLLAFLACSSTPKPCSESDAVMAAHAAECKVRVEQECKGIPDEECVAIRECDEWGEKRCKEAP